MEVILDRPRSDMNPALGGPRAAPAGAAAPAGKTSRPWKTIGKVALLVSLLAIHFAVRWHHAETMPLADRHNYERSYVYSMSIMAGRGFHDLAVPATAAAEPINRFLDKESDRITNEEFANFLDSARPSDVDAKTDEHERWVSSRILDQYVVAGLWQLFGIRWSVVFLFGVTLSTLTCLCVFFIGRRLSDSYWAGLAAAVLFSAEPLASYLETWSLRDASPLWFSAAGFCFLFCGVDHVTMPLRRLLACGGLGVVAMIGVGWRPDVFLSVLYIGFSLTVLAWLRGMNWRQVLGGTAIYGLSAWACLAAVRSLTTEPAVDSQNGFHMAAYADFSRANLLKIENSFQIHRCDRETLFVAREYEQARNPDGPPLPFIGSRYSVACRSMFLEELKYNAFWFAVKSPEVYWKALDGLKTPGAFETMNDEQLQQGRLPQLSQAYRTILDPITARLPWLFLLGLFVATAFGPARPQAALLGGFTVLQVAALLLVLPEQKHLATLQLPLCVLGGIGAWTLLGLLRPSNWPRRAQIVSWRPSKTWLAVVGGGVAAWGAACGIAYFVSLHERNNLIADIQAVARDGVPAPETVHGDKVFSVNILPESAADSTGYLLKISAGAPGTLLCRHIHFPQDWCWPRVLETTHLLHPGREQYFFVSCFQGSRFGDPRPYNCSVFLDGDARIESCQRVDLKTWNRLQVSTVFYDGQKSPGSPRSIAGNSLMRWPDWPVIQAFTADQPAARRLAKSTIYVGPQPLPALSHPIQQLVARDKTTGVWQIAVNDGRKFQPANLNYWAPGEWSVIVGGDFNGDGLTDLVGRFTDGSWWFGRANGNNIEFKPCQIDLTGVAFDFVGVGDFNGDGIDDLVVRAAADGQWWIGLSDGIRFSFHRAGQSAAGVPSENVRIADFNGDGRADIAGFNPTTGEWTVALSDGAQLVTRLWGQWDPAIAWRHILAADFAGSGRTDVAAWNPTTGQWQLARSNGKQFDSQPAGAWPTDADWRHVQTGRFSGDRSRGIVGLDSKSKRLAIAEFDGQQFTTRLLPAHPALNDGIYVGSFSGSDRDDLVGLSKDNAIWVGLLDHDAIHFENRGVWPAAQRLTDFRVLSFWR